MRTRQRTQSTRSQEMLQELFAEINDYLGDSPKPTPNGNVPSSTTEYPTDNNDAPPILLESDDEGEKHEIETSLRRTPQSSSYDDVCPVTGDKSALCICYKCNHELCENNTPMYDHMQLPKERVTPTRSQSTIIDSNSGTSNNGISFGCIADRVKQTFGSTDHKSTKNDKPARRWISRPKSLPSLKSTFGMTEGKSSQADIVMTASTSTGYKQPSSYHHQQHDIPAEDQYQGQPTHAIMGGLTGLHEQQPFLTPSARTGNEHVAFRMAESRSIPRRQDRMMAYTNAYHDCIMARTNIIPWLTKQYSKGPPDAMFEYTPKPRKVGKSILSIFKRCAEKQQQQQQHKQQQHMQPISTYIVSTNTPSPLQPSQQQPSSEPGLAYSSSSSSSNDTTPISVLNGITTSINNNNNNNHSHISTSSGSSISIHHDTTPSPLYGNQSIMDDPSPCSLSPSIKLAPSSSTGHQKEKQPVSILKKTLSSTSLPPPRSVEEDYPPRNRLLRTRRHRSMYAPPAPPAPPMMDDLYDQDDYYDDLDDADYYYRGSNGYRQPPPPPPVAPPVAMEYQEDVLDDGSYYDDSMDEDEITQEEGYYDDDPYYYNRRRMLPRTRPPPLTRMLPPPPMMRRRRSLYMDDPRRRFRSTRRVYC